MYPVEAREKRIEGEAVASFLVSETGEVGYVQGWKADRALVHAVEDAVAKWKFKPVTKDGKPIPVVGKAVFRFVLSDESQLANGVSGEIEGGTDIPKRVRVSSGVIQGLLVTRVNPSYPEDARRKGIQGAVLLRASIDREGTVSDLQLISGPPELVPAAIEAVKQWRYRPYLFMGLPMEVESQILINFTLAGR